MAASVPSLRLSLGSAAPGLSSERGDLLLCPVQWIACVEDRRARDSRIHCDSSSLRSASGQPRILFYLCLFLQKINKNVCLTLGHNRRCLMRPTLTKTLTLERHHIPCILGSANGRILHRFDRLPGRREGSLRFKSCLIACRCSAVSIRTPNICLIRPMPTPTVCLNDTVLAVPEFGVNLRMRIPSMRSVPGANLEVRPCCAAQLEMSRLILAPRRASLTRSTLRHRTTLLMHGFPLGVCLYDSSQQSILRQCTAHLRSCRASLFAPLLLFRHCARPSICFKSNVRRLEPPRPLFTLVRATPSTSTF